MVAIRGDTDRRLEGTVAEWDEAAGYGQIAAVDGERYFLHCTAIADGTRSIDPDARVAFRVVAGPMGRWEAAELTKLA